MKRKEKEPARATLPPRPEPAIGSQDACIQIGKPRQGEEPWEWAQRADETLTAVMATVLREVKIDSRRDEATNTKQTWLNDCNGRGVYSLNGLQPLFENPRGVGSDKASRIAGTMAICMLLWPRHFPTDRAVLAAGFWLRPSTSSSSEKRRDA